MRVHLGFLYEMVTLPRLVVNLAILSQEKKTVFLFQNEVQKTEWRRLVQWPADRWMVGSPFLLPGPQFVNYSDDITNRDGIMDEYFSLVYLFCTFNIFYNENVLINL